MTETATSGKSAASVGLAALSVGLWAFTGLPVPAILLPGAACIALALLGLGDIRRRDGRLGGRRLAIGSVVAVAAMLLLLAIVPAVRKVGEAREGLAVT